jgi:hypothetical protein
MREVEIDEQWERARLILAVPTLRNAWMVDLSGR